MANRLISVTEYRKSGAPILMKGGIMNKSNAIVPATAAIIAGARPHRRALTTTASRYSIATLVIAIRCSIGKPNSVIRITRARLPRYGVQLRRETRHGGASSDALLEMVQDTTDLWTRTTMEAAVTSLCLAVTRIRGNLAPKFSP